MTDRPITPTLDRVIIPSDLKGLTDAELRLLADELRSEVVSAVSETGGHLGSSLGVVEMTVALHAVFNTPHDKIVWDVGHQCYPHKILTGRRDRIRTLRQEGGLSGCAFLNLYLSGIGVRDRARPWAEHRRCDCCDWGWVDQRGHGLRGAEQCRIRGASAVRDPER